MRITRIYETPLGCASYLNVARDHSLVREHLPILRAVVARLLAQLDGLVRMADLQDREQMRDGPVRLLGLPVCEGLLRSRTRESCRAAYSKVDARVVILLRDERFHCFAPSK